jgi:predicted aldo/keto reductase-like oxidoreductase
LVDETEWQTALGPHGALEAIVEARDKGLVRFIGVTGHGTRVAAMHRRSLERFAFDSVLFPYNFTMLGIPQYSADVEALLKLCNERGVATQTIKSVARRRWQNDNERKFSWYEPLRDRDAIRRAVHFVLSRPGLFLNSSNDHADHPRSGEPAGDRACARRNGSRHRAIRYGAAVHSERLRHHLETRCDFPAGRARASV